MREKDNAMSELGDKFRWVAHNNDGGSVSQVAASGEKNAYEDLPLDNLKSFELWDWRKDQRVLFVTFKKGERLVWRRRFEIKPGSEVTEVCHIVGKIGKDGQKGILGIFESDGRIEAVGEFLPTSNWFYPPQSEEAKTD
jgi:hypothetical protein